MTSVKLDNRLLSVASYIRQGAYMADIGTDHAYLPVYLCQSGKISRAIASDIAKGPCERATATVERAGLSDRISVVMTNGLQGLGEQGLTDIAHLQANRYSHRLQVHPDKRAPDIQSGIRPDALQRHRMGKAMIGRRGK